MITLYNSILLFRCDTFDAALKDEVVDLSNLKSLCFGGVPEGRGRRALCWKLLLNYLPIEKALWKENLERQRQLYYQLTGLDE